MISEGESNKSDERRAPSLAFKHPDPSSHRVRRIHIGTLEQRPRTLDAGRAQANVLLGNAQRKPQKRRNSNDNTERPPKRRRTGQGHYSGTIDERHSEGNTSIYDAVSLSRRTMTPATSFSKAEGELANQPLASNTWSLTQWTIHAPSGSDLRILDSLPRHPDVSGVLSEYLQGSRDEEMKYVYAWIATSSELVLSIYAPAGLGKTTFARKLAEDLRSRNGLAAALFMNFAPSDWGPETVIRAIAGEIGRIHPKAMPSIANAIHNFGGSSINPSQLFDQYIRLPIQSLQLPQPLAILIDAIDEWKSYLLFIKQLANLETSRHLVKFIILGRVKHRIGDFADVSISVYPLPPASTYVLVEFFNRRFARISNWGGAGRPGPNQVIRLAEKANGVFVWARTVYTMLATDYRRASRWQILEETIQSQRTVGNLGLLAELYHGSLTRLFPEEEEREYLRSYLQAIFVLHEPLPIGDFARLIRMEEDTVQSIRDRLRALQTHESTDSDSMIHPAAAVFHLSVTEYFQSASTPQKFAFHISLVDANAVLARACLDLLPKLFPAATGDTALRLFQTLWNYVLKYWPLHFTQGTPPVVPDSGLGFQQNPLCLALQGVPFSTLRAWAHALLPSDMQNSDLLAIREGGPLLRYAGDSLYQGSSNVPALSIACLELAVRLRTEVATVWTSLGWAYCSQAEKTHSPEACEKAIAINRHAVHLTAMSSEEDEAVVKGGLACALRTGFSKYGGHLGSSSVLEESISLLKQGLQLQHNPGHRSCMMYNLAHALWTRYNATNATDDLVEVIELSRKALELCPEGHTDRSMLLNSLAISLNNQFNTTGVVDSLEESIYLYREALEILPEGHADRSTSLYNIAISLRRHFEVASDIDTLNESIQRDREALELRPAGHPDLGFGLHLRSKHQNDVQDSYEAISLNDQALALCPQIKVDDRVFLLENASLYAGTLADLLGAGAGGE